MKPSRMLELVPGRPPFMMIDRLVECVPNERITTLKCVTLGDPSVAVDAAGCLPESLLLEGMSQSAGLLLRLSRPEDDGPLPGLGRARIRFGERAVAGSPVRYEVFPVELSGPGGTFRASARQDDRLVAEAELTLGPAQDDD